MEVMQVGVPQERPNQKGTFDVHLENIQDSFKFNNREYTLFEIDSTHMQRDHVRRAQSMARIFSEYQKSMSEYHLQFVPNDFTIKEHGEEKFIKAGLYVSNGNTRIYCYKKGYNSIPNVGVTITINTTKTYQDMRNDYYSRDNKTASETTSDLLSGIGRELGFTFISKMKDYKWTTVIRNAYPGDDRDSLAVKVSYFKEALQLLDESMIFNSKITQLNIAQVRTAALLFVQMNIHNPIRVLDILKGIATTTQMGKHSKKYTLDCAKDSRQGMTWMLSTLINPDKNKYDLDSISREQRFERPIAFFLHCLEMQITGHTYERITEKNWWKGKDNNSYTDTLKTLLQNNGFHAFV